jgi:preprotein translocase subunit SecD
MGFVGSLFAVFAFGVHGVSINRMEYHRPTPAPTANERIQQRNERNVGENERNERIPQTYRHRLETAGVTVPPADTVLDQPIDDAKPDVQDERIHERNHERTSTLSLSETDAEEGGATLPAATYNNWKQAVVDGQCETIVRDMRLWLQDTGAVEQGKTKVAQAVAESYLAKAQYEGFIREIPGWVSGMRRKYEWTGQGGNAG